MSRYVDEHGDEYQGPLYGVDHEQITEIPESGPLSLTLQFQDVSDLDQFSDIAHGIDWENLTAEEADRWTRFCLALKALTEAAPRRTLDDVSAVSAYSYPDMLTLNSQYGKSYHAQIDARRGIPSVRDGYFKVEGDPS